MAPVDLPLAFLRHATSKIRSLDDLRTIRTLGFRGEALASIAAVARVEAVSRPRDGGEGYRVLVEGGSQIAAGPTGSPVGTRVSVSRLFFNTPARLKFLKQPATETAVIVCLVGELALAHPSVGFTLDIDRRRVLETPGTGDRRGGLFGGFGGPAPPAPPRGDHGNLGAALRTPRLDRAS